MKKVVFNNANLGKNDINKEVRKVRALIFNKEGQVMVSEFSDGAHILPGGKIDKGETIEEALKREIREETGILISENEIGEPFLGIVAYDANYPDSKTGREINKLTKTVFYEIHTGQNIDTTNQNLSEREIKSGLGHKYMNLTRLRYFIETDVKGNYKRNLFNREILKVLDEYAEYKQQEQNKIKGR